MPSVVIGDHRKKIALILTSMLLVVSCIEVLECEGLENIGVWHTSKYLLL